MSQRSPVRRLVNAAAKPGRAANFVHDLGDAGGAAAWRRSGRQGSASGGVAAFTGCDMQPAITQFDTFEFTAPQPAGEAPQPPIEFGAAPGQPFVGRRRQSQLGRDRGNRGRRQQVAVEAAVIGRPLDPDVAGAQLVAQRREHGGLIEAPIWLSVLGDQPLPFLAERHGRVRRHVALARAVEILQQLDRGQASGRGCAPP